MVLRDPITRADIPALCERVRALLELSEVDTVICEVGALDDPDAVTVDALARLQLTARRLGRRVRFRGACGELLDLLAFVAALQHLPSRQRAVLILREVLRWKASEVAELLETSVASVNSALQRARSTLETIDVNDSETLQPKDEAQRALLERYVDAFERYDMDSLTSLLREDATWSMPPYEMWLQTHDDIRRWCLGPGIGCRGSRLIPVEANGSPAFGQYKPAPDGSLEPWSLQVLEISDGEIAGISFFLDTERLFPLFGLPPRLER